jgi:hypothetical protein
MTSTAAQGMTELLNLRSIAHRVIRSPSPSGEHAHGAVVLA